GFVDEVPDTERDAIIHAVRRRLDQIPAPTVTFRHATIRSEAIALYPHPAGPLHTIRARIRDAIADVWGADRVPESGAGYQPHLSMTYVNKDAGPSSATDAITMLNLSPARLTLGSASCIALQRVNHAYHWHTYAAAHLADWPTRAPE